MIKRIAIVAVVIVLAAAGFVGYYLFRPPEEASAPIEAVPLNLENNEDNEDNEDTQAADAETTTEDADPVAETENESQAEEAVEPAAGSDAEVETEAAVETEPVESVENEAAEAAPEADPAESVEDEAAEAAPEADPAESVEDEAAEAAPEADPAESVQDEAAEAAPETDPAEAQVAAEPTIFEIVPTESEARFEIDEVLRGDPVTVVGATDQVAGQLALDPDNLASTRLGTVQVNARTLATDNNFRNRAIKNAILLTDDYEFVTFNPTEISGLPDSAAPGETITFQIMGDLTVTDVTRPVTFDITATPVSETRIEGTASTAFLYTDFELFIPDAPAVDTVDDEVRLEIDFVAEAVGEVAG